MRRGSMSFVVSMLAITLISMPVSFSSEFRDGRKAYEQGEYDKAVTLLAQALREKPKHDDAAELLLVVLPIAFERHKAAATDAELQQNWDTAVAEYKAMSKLSSDVRSLPPVMKAKTKPPQPIQWPVVDITAQYRDSLQKAAEMHYARGVSLMEGGKGREAAAEFVASQQYIPNYKDSQTLAAEAHYRRGTELRTARNHKEAAIEFRSAVSYARDYKDASALYQECRTAAIKRVAVMPFENKSGKEQFGAIGELMSDQVISKALGSQPEFIEFVTRDQLKQLMAEKGQQDFGIVDQGSAVTAGKIANVHAFVFGKILTVMEQFPGDQVKGPQVNSVQWHDYNTKQDYTLTAQVMAYTRQGSVEVTATLSIVDGEKGTVLKADQMKEKREDLARWIKFQGDERAVPSWARDFETPGGERAIKTSEALVQESIDGLSTRLAQQFVQYFN